MGQPPAGDVITFGTPAFLLAGALAALVPLALHLIRRRPPSRAPLPTERFLSPDPRTAVRVSRPTDPLLLALRMLLLVLAGAAFARPVWFPAARGTREVVLLDTGAGIGDAWPQAVAEARRRLLAPDGTLRGELVLFDTLGVRMHRVTEATFATLAGSPPSRAPSRYSAALRSIPAAARELRGADSIRVTLITRPRWSAWSDGIAPLRRAAWPGAIEVVAIQGAAAADSARVDTASREAIYLVGDRPAPVAYAKLALEATGWTVRDVPAANAVSMGSARLAVVAAPVPAATADALRLHAESGATVLVTAPAAASFRDLLPWRGAMRVDSTGGAMWLASGEHVSGAATRVSGDAAPDAAAIAAWEDGRPAAAARRIGRGCIVFAATDLERGEMTLDAAYPRVIDHLARGCESPAPGDGEAPLDAGARAVLRGRGPAVVAAGAVPGAGGGIALGRWVMAAALLAALTETFFAYGRTKSA
ncbi:MAG TPA: BatA domain-containing protein [Longimicrobium sp.]